MVFTRAPHLAAMLLRYPEDPLQAKASKTTASSGGFFTKVIKKGSFPEGKDPENYTFLISIQINQSINQAAAVVAVAAAASDSDLEMDSEMAMDSEMDSDSM